MRAGCFAQALLLGAEEEHPGPQGPNAVGLLGAWRLWAAWAHSLSAQGLSRKKSAVERALRKRKNPLFHAQILREFKCL